MIKRFLIALIVGLFVMSLQIAFAEDWSSVRNFSSKADLARWIETGRREGHTVFNFTLTNMNVTADEMSNGITVGAGDVLKSPLPGNYNYYTYYLNELPGTRVANAYLSSDKRTAWLKLTAEEKQLYNVAVGIVTEANKYSSEIEKERYIHDEICRRAEPMRFAEDRYYRDKNGDYVKDNVGNKKIKPFATAAGVLNNGENGQGICSAYGDAFYMLCRMCNLDVVRVGGMHVGGNGHEWNAIKLNGKVYFVDVYWDDEGNTDEFFNKSAEFFRQEHSWDYVVL